MWPGLLLELLQLPGQSEVLGTVGQRVWPAEEGEIMIKIKRPLSIDQPSYRYGILIAAEIASEYDGSSTHPYNLRDCILAKLNLLPKSKMRKNKTGAKIEAVLLRLEHKVASLEGTIRFMTRRSSGKK
jgi:hypothetical protein